MAVTDTDIVFYRSANGNSEGGARSATEIVDGVANALFPNISDAERIAGGTLYRKWFATNEHATDAMLAPVAWIEAMPIGVSEHLGVGFDDADDDEAVLSGNMTAWDANAVLSAESDGADTRSLSIVGLSTGGAPLTDVLTLNGTTPALTSTSFSAVYAVMADSKSARAVTIRQGSGGTIRGTILANRAVCFLWLNPTTKVGGIKLSDLLAGASIGFWDRLVWAAGVSAQRPTYSNVALEEA